MLVESFYRSQIAWRKTPDHPFTSAGLDTAEMTVDELWGAYLNLMKENTSIVVMRCAEEKPDGTIIEDQLTIKRYNELDICIGYEIVVGTEEELDELEMRIHSHNPED